MSLLPYWWTGTVAAVRDLVLVLLLPASSLMGRLWRATQERHNEVQSETCGPQSVLSFAGLEGETAECGHMLWFPVSCVPGCCWHTHGSQERAPHPHFLLGYPHTRQEGEDRAQDRQNLVGFWVSADSSGKGGAGRERAFLGRFSHGSLRWRPSPGRSLLVHISLFDGKCECIHFIWGWTRD